MSDNPPTFREWKQQNSPNFDDVPEVCLAGEYYRTAFKDWPVMRPDWQLWRPQQSWIEQPYRSLDETLRQRSALDAVDRSTLQATYESPSGTWDDAWIRATAEKLAHDARVAELTQQLRSHAHRRIVAITALILAYLAVVGVGVPVVFMRLGLFDEWAMTLTVALFLVGVAGVVVFLLSCIHALGSPHEPLDSGR